MYLTDGWMVGFMDGWMDGRIDRVIDRYSLICFSSKRCIVFRWKLIRPEEMNNPKVDEMSMMTYLSQFPSAKLKTGAPLRPRTNPSRVRTYGPGMLMMHPF